MVELPAISLWQPYASLIFAPCQSKKHETRSRAVPDRVLGEIVAIHAAATFPSYTKIGDELHALCLREFGHAYRRSLPLGGFLGTVRIDQWASTDFYLPVDDQDRICGDWSRVRYAWRLSDPVLLPTFVPARGRQSWFRATFDERDVGRDHRGLPLEEIDDTSAPADPEWFLETYEREASDD